MEQPEAKDKPIIHLADKLSASDTCEWSKNKDLQVCLVNSYISPSIEWLLNKTLVLLYDSTRTSSLGWTFL